MTRGAPKQRVAFRLDSDLAAALRQLSNQTAFVEGIRRQVLGQPCPLCHGTGDAPGVHMNISDLKPLPNSLLDRGAATRIRALVRLGRQLLATERALVPTNHDSELEFRLEREDQLVLQGRIPCGVRDLELS